MSAVATLSSTQTPPFITFTNFNPVKLTRDNYPLWLPQIVPHLRGGNLFGYVDGTTPPHRPLFPPPVMVLLSIPQTLLSYIGPCKTKSFLVLSIPHLLKTCSLMLHVAPPPDLPGQLWRRSSRPTLVHAPCRFTINWQL